MHGLIPQLLILLGIGGGAILLVRKAKYVPDEGLRVVVETGEKLKIFWREAVANRFPKDEIEMKLWATTEKAIRRGRIVAMKTDYLLLKALEQLKAHREKKQLDGDYWKEFAKPEVRFSTEDLLEAELRLSTNPLFATHDEYRRLAEIYLAKSEVSDARRLLIEAWRRAPKDADTLAKFEAV